MRRLLLSLALLAGTLGAQIFPPPSSGSSGTVTSVGISLPSSLCAVTGSPVTTTGTLTCTFATGQTANQVLGTNGSGNVGLMSLGTAQLPSASSIITYLSLVASATTDTTNASNISSGTLGAARLPAALSSSTSVNGTSIPASGTLTQTIASGATAMGTSAIASGACASAVTATATGTATTDVLTASFNSDPTGVTGYVPSTSGMLTIVVYPTANTANFKVCNLTSSSITPGALTLNWRVVR